MGGFCEKVPEASPMSNRANATRLQDGPAVGQGQTSQRQWLCLWDNRFKKGGKTLRNTSSSQKRGVRISERNNSADTKVSEEGGGGGAPGATAEIPLQPVVKTMVRQAVPLQPMEVNGGADIHLQPMEDPH